MRMTPLSILFPLAHCALLAGCGSQASESPLSSRATAAKLDLSKSSNPYDGAKFYVNPSYSASVQASLAKEPAVATALRTVANTSTGIWVSSIDLISLIAPALNDALAQQEAAQSPVVATFVVYNLPDRDCAAASSAGELVSAAGGLGRYKAEYIDAIAAQFRAHPNQPISVVLEPDSLPNLATNLGIAKCAAAATTYRDGIAYAINKLSMPNVAIYLDAGFAGWLGWDDNRQKAAAIFRSVLDQAGGADKIRGFSTNVSNYDPTLVDPKSNRGDSFYSSNPCHDELTYVEKLSQALESQGIMGKTFLIDSSRNGQPDPRSDRGNWCNAKSMGLGERPRASPAPLVDANYWVKPPGESDGTSDSSAPRFDARCLSSDSMSPAPEAGLWFHDYLMTLVQNANPPL